MFLKEAKKRMTMVYNSIAVFDYWAKQYCPILFEGDYESYIHYLRRTKRRYESVLYTAERVELKKANEPIFESYVYHLKKARSSRLVVSMLERCPMSHWVYSCSRTTDTFISTKICYYWDTDKGMYLIIPECDGLDRVNDIVVRVYEDLETFIFDIFKLWSLVSKTSYYTDGSPMKQSLLLKELLMA